MLKRYTYFAKRVEARLGREFRRFKNKICWTFVASHPNYRENTREILGSRFDWLDAHTWEELFVGQKQSLEQLRLLCNEFIAHRFDLLGSGPIHLRHGVECIGVKGYRYATSFPLEIDEDGKLIGMFINRSNRTLSRHVWSLIDRGYQPLDWQLDFKSGFRWSEGTISTDLKLGHLPGIDVKVPWELARLQHLPLLAVACHAARYGEDGFLPFETYAREIRNQILDFVASNPPGYGVNWICCMDVAIRVANMLLAIDILRAARIDLDSEFESIVLKTTHSHGKFVANNLEWHPVYRGNHFLAGIVGLIFCGNYLPRCKETDGWLSFSTQTLIEEIGNQFHSDGSNFEASVCYHRLSAEITLWGVSILLNLSKEKLEIFNLAQSWQGPLPKSRLISPLALYSNEKFEAGKSPVPEWCLKHLLKMACFTRWMTRPDGLVVQFGDNDSGRFATVLSLEQLQTGADPGLPEWSLNHKALLQGVDAIHGHCITDPGSRLLQKFAGIPRILQLSHNEPDSDMVPDNDGRLNALEAVYWATPNVSRIEKIFEAQSDLTVGLKQRFFPGMGCYITRSDCLYLAIRCGEIGLKGLGAHAHFDQLAVELVIDGKDIVRDPGSYLYTALPQERNKYRSVLSHCAPHVGTREPGNLELGLFDLRGLEAGECLYFGAKGFVGRHRGYGKWIYRMVLVCDRRLLIRDYSPEGLLVTDPLPIFTPFSQGYGRIEA